MKTYKKINHNNYNANNCSHREVPEKIMYNNINISTHHINTTKIEVKNQTKRDFSTLKNTGKYITKHHKNFPHSETPLNNFTNFHYKTTLRQTHTTIPLPPPPPSSPPSPPLSSFSCKKQAKKFANANFDNNRKWHSLDEQKQFFDELYKELKLKSLNDWYFISPDVISLYPGGHSILFPSSPLPSPHNVNNNNNNINNDNEKNIIINKEIKREEEEEGEEEKKEGMEGLEHIRVLKKVYPHHHWNDLLYAKKTIKFWNRKNTKEFLDHILSFLSSSSSSSSTSSSSSISTSISSSISSSISTSISLSNRMEKWYWIPSYPKLFEALNAMSLMKKYKGSYVNLIADIYPHYPWDLSRFLSSFDHTSSLLSIFLSLHPPFSSPPPSFSSTSSPSSEANEKEEIIVKIKRRKYLTPTPYSDPPSPSPPDNPSPSSPPPSIPIPIPILNDAAVRDVKIEDGIMGIKDAVKYGIEGGIAGGIEDGIKDGVKEGIEGGVKEGVKEGITRRIENGIMRGIEDGIEYEEEEEEWRWGKERSPFLHRYFSLIHFIDKFEMYEKKDHFLLSNSSLSSSQSTSQSSPSSSSSSSLSPSSLSSPSIYRWRERNEEGYQRRWMDMISIKLKMKSKEEWNGITHKEFERMGGKWLLKLHGGSVYSVLTNVYPDHHWNPLLRSKLPRNYWSDPFHLRSFFDNLYDKLGYTSMDDWFSLSLSTLKENGGVGLVGKKGGVWKALSLAYPSHSFSFSNPLHPLRRSPSRFKSILHQQTFFDHLYDKLKLKSMEEWKKVSGERLRKEGAGRIMKRYKGNLFTALTKIYPHYPWPDLFLSLHRGRKDKGKYQVKEDHFPLLSLLIQRHFHVENPSHWQRISNKDISSFIGHFPGGLPSLLSLSHPSLFPPSSHPSSPSSSLSSPSPSNLSPPSIDQYQPDRYLSDLAQVVKMNADWPVINGNAKNKKRRKNAKGNARKAKTFRLVGLLRTLLPSFTLLENYSPPSFSSSFLSKYKMNSNSNNNNGDNNNNDRKKRKKGLSTDTGEKFRVFLPAFNFGFVFTTVMNKRKNEIKEEICLSQSIRFLPLSPSHLSLHSLHSLLFPLLPSFLSPIPPPCQSN